MIEEQALISGVKTNYKIKGQGIPLLILHGWGGSSSSWIGVQDILCKKGFRIVSPDFPGFGQSAVPKTAWNLDDYVKWLSEFVKYMELEKFCLLGHSFGGRVAVKFAVANPEKIEKLILCDAAGIKISPSLKTVTLKLAAEMGNFVLDRRYLRIVRDFLRNILYFFIKQKDYVKAEGLMRETMKLILEENLLPLLPKISSKTLIIWGQDDKLVLVGVSYKFRDNIRGSVLEIFPNVGHSPHMEIPDKLSESVFNFVKQ